MIYLKFHSFQRVFTDLNVVQTISRAGGIVRQVCLASPVFMLTCLSLINIFLGPFTQIAPVRKVLQINKWNKFHPNF